MPNTIQLAIHGASGRNGKRLIALSHLDSEVKLVGAIVGKASHSLGQDAGVLAGLGPIDLKLTSEIPEHADVVIDFSTPQGCMELLSQCVLHETPAVIATTGLSSEQIAAIQDAAHKIPICYAPNMSVAVNVAMKLVQQAAAALKNTAGGVDVEIIERHHRMKEDSPSGTALKFGQIVAHEMSIHEHVHGREGLLGKRPQSEIGYHAVRIGDDAGQHTICFGMMGEIIEIRVGASNRDPYATGAIMAAKWLVNRPAGLYSMWDVLGLAG
ncbi:MAG: 4-hydroxy-tetrahydrodipicolinate reductase [Planctomycetota bacterium]|nr:4-hydroxy-tetrahydrodipicolinate reductase [Planctomycetota bacterium]